MTDTRPIGVLDSGIGGLSVLRAIQSHLPQENLLYLADQIHLPYGQKTLEQIRQFTAEITRYLLAQDAKLIVIACNTASAAALHHVRALFPQMPFVGLEPAVRPAARDTHRGKIAVIATRATFQGDLYASLIERFAQEIDVIARACPELVELAERGQPWTPADYEQVSEILREIRESGADQLVLGCTHFTFVKPLLQAALGEQVAIIDPAPAIARQVGRVLAERQLANISGFEGQTAYFTTGDEQRFREQIQTLLNVTPMQVQKLSWQGKLII